MMQTTFSLLTNKGRLKEAMALANGSDIIITHIAVGDGNTVPSGGETKLYHEVDRKKITGHGLVPGSTDTAYFEIHLMANDGPYTIHEAGLFDADGDLIAIAYYDPPIPKPTPESGQTVEGDVRMEISFSNVQNIVVQVDMSMQVPLQRLTVKPWIPVKSLTVTTPPTDPKVGDTYVIPTDATGIWKGQSQKVAEFTSAGWAVLAAPDGHGIGLPDGSIYIKKAGKYVLLTDLLDSRYSQQTEPPADTFYVVGPSGNDKNSGLKPTAAEGFATIQGAVDALSSRYMTQGSVTLEISPGTYKSVSVEKALIANWHFSGDRSDSDKVKIVAENSSGRSAAFVASRGVNVQINNLSFYGVDACFSCVNADVSIYDCNITLTTPNGSGIQTWGGSVSVFNKMRVTGKGNNIFQVADGGKLSFGYFDRFNKYPVNILFNEVSASNAIFSASGGANLIVASPVVTFNGVPSGTAYVAANNAIINTWGGGLSIFPGTQPGYVSTGGQAN